MRYLLIGIGAYLVAVRGYGDCNYVASYDINGYLNLDPSKTVVPGYCVVDDSRTGQSKKWFCNSDNTVSATTYYNSLTCETLTCNLPGGCKNSTYDKENTEISYQCGTGMNCAVQYKAYYWPCDFDDTYCIAEYEHCDIRSDKAYYDQRAQLTDTCVQDINGDWIMITCTDTTLTVTNFGIDSHCDSKVLSNDTVDSDSNCSEHSGENYIEIMKCTDYTIDQNGPHSSDQTNMISIFTPIMLVLTQTFIFYY
eukprot:376335_1